MRTETLKYTYISVCARARQREKGSRIERAKRVHENRMKNDNEDVEGPKKYYRECIAYANRMYHNYRIDN